MYNKLIAILMAVVLVFVLCACSSQPEPQPQQPEKPSVSPEAQDPSDENNPTAPESNPGAENDDPVDVPSSDPVEDIPDQVAVSLDEVRAAMIAGLSVVDPLLLETDMLVDLYGISSDMLKQSASFVTMSGTFPDEVILTEAVDDAAAEAIASALQKRLDEVMVQSKTYDAENYEAAQQCKVARNGLFIALILSPNQADMTAIYESFFA